jgi:hypothetical protein
MSPICFSGKARIKAGTLCPVRNHLVRADGTLPVDKMPPG